MPAEPHLGKRLLCFVFIQMEHMLQCSVRAPGIVFGNRANSVHCLLPSDLAFFGARAYVHIRMLVPTWEDFSHIQGSIGWLFPLLHTCDYSGPYENRSDL